jgi:hypothetical protein
MKTYRFIFISIIILMACSCVKKDSGTPNRADTVPAYGLHITSDKQIYSLNELIKIDVKFMNNSKHILEVYDGLIPGVIFSLIAHDQNNNIVPYQEPRIHLLQCSGGGNGDCHRRSLYSNEYFGQIIFINDAETHSHYEDLRFKPGKYKIYVEYNTLDNATFCQIRTEDGKVPCERIISNEIEIIVK